MENVYQANYNQKKADIAISIRYKKKKERKKTLRQKQY